ncbi:kinase-like domain-containing protein [Mycena pura]|uniref:Kinase-like domain-containing protein n=1 Tax=Mycena pura TaxID=153505 RepID=A0AAD6VHG5_9AGAR|nr:kinase-like domain-containing protein [Mycena pura]
MADPAGCASDDLQQTQEDQQQTQPLTQPGIIETNDQIWAYFQPCLSQSLSRIDLYKTHQDVTIGRNVANAVIFPGFKISNFHAIIKWNGLENAASVVTIEDISSNGTFLTTRKINGDKIGKGQRRLLKDGNEVAFGVATVSKEDNGIFDYRESLPPVVFHVRLTHLTGYIFRDLVSGSVKRALYNSYDILSQLGKGSFATVYKALHMSSGEWVAVKVIHEERHFFVVHYFVLTSLQTKRPGPLANTASEAVRLGRSHANSREINIMESLRHPNICQLREVFWNVNGSIDLVLELVEGGDLLDYILQRNGLNEAMSKHIIYQLCQALAYIHGKGITHRDLKPENVLLTKDDPPIVKVADFGLAKIVDSMTMLKTMCGTPSYLAPEVVTQQNNGGYDSLVDSWSVGVILFSIFRRLSNTTPFLENSLDDLRTRIAERLIDWTQLDNLWYPNVDGIDVRLTDHAKDFIRKLLEFDPQQRMKLTQALHHPWLNNYSFYYDIDYPQTNGAGGANSSSSGPSRDVSMRSAAALSFSAPSETDSVSQGIELLKLKGSVSGGWNRQTVAAAAEPMANGQPMPNADESGDRRTPPSTPPGLTLLRKGGLQRRSEVLRHAKETGASILEPSWEMVQYAASQDSLYAPAEAEASESGSGSDTTTNANTNGKGPNKRVHSELTPLPEEDDGDGAVDSVQSSPLSSLGDLPTAPARKRTRSNGDELEVVAGAAPNTRSKRGAKAPALPSARKTRVTTDNAQTPVGTRRSTRAKKR